jgi:hypothetical protein
VIESAEGFGDISGHGYVNIFLRIVPVDCQAAILAAGPVDGYVVVFLECFDEVEAGIIAVEVLDAKVIDGQCECGREWGVVPEARHVCDWSAAVGAEFLDKAVIRYDARLFEAIYTFSDSGVKVSVTDQWVKVVRFQHFLWDVYLVRIVVYWRSFIGLLR